MSSRRVPLRGIYFVTDPAMTLASRERKSQAISTDRLWHTQAIDATVETIEQALRAGVTTVQLRWKQVDSGYFLDLAKAASEVTQGRAQLIINDRVDVFLAARESDCAVDGVHIGQTDIHPTLVRALIGDDAQLGWSVSLPRDLDEALELTEVIDSAGVGALRETSTKTDAPPSLGLEGIARIAQRLPLPVTAIGGIGVDDVAPLASRVHNVAVVSAIAAAQDPFQAAAQLVEAFKTGQKTEEQA